MWIDALIAAHCEQKIFCQTWVPTATVIVLGSSNDPKQELFLENISGDTPILKRAGGGGAVVLHKGCIIIGVGAWVKNQFGNKEYFKKLNGALIDALEKSGNFGDIQQAGISDLAVDGKKLCGTSLFRSKNYLLFQGSILLEKNTDLISKLLKHPSKEPDYRAKRSHEDFLTDLVSLDVQAKDKDFLRLFTESFGQKILERLEKDFCEVDFSHTLYLKKRFLSIVSST